MPGGSDGRPPSRDNVFKSPGRDPIEPGGRYVPKVRDAYRVAAYEFVRLMMVLAREGDEKREDPKIAPFRIDFCNVVEKDLGGPLRSGECDLAWRAWTETSKTIPQVANFLEQQ